MRNRVRHVGRANARSAWVWRVMVGAAAVVTAIAPASRASAQQPAAPAMGPAMGMRWSNTLFVLFDQLEYASTGRDRPVNVDAVGWYGGAVNRVWVRAQSEFATARRQGEAEGQLLAGHLVRPFWDAVAGLRVDTHWGDGHRTRTQLALGLLGLAPYRFAFSPTVFVASDGSVSFRVEAATDWLVTQRLVAEPEFELNAALRAAPKYGINRSGISDYEAGFRLRFDVRRELAPYIGWSRSRRVSGTSSALPRSEPVAESRFVLGVRAWR